MDMTSLSMKTIETPIPVDQPMPHRKVIREWLVPLSERTTFSAIFLLILDLSVWALFLAGTVVFQAWWAKLICAIGAGFTIGRLFIIGHDACHQSLTSGSVEVLFCLH